MRDVASAIISHEQTQSNRDCGFQTSDAVFKRIHFQIVLYQLCHRRDMLTFLTL